MVKLTQPTQTKDPRVTIISQAISIVSKNGFNAVSLQEILDELQITKGRFFHYFSSKDQFFEQVLDYALKYRPLIDLKSAADKCESSDPFVKLISVITHAIDWHRQGLSEVMRLMSLASLYFANHSEQLEKIRAALIANTTIVRELTWECQQNGQLPRSLNADTFSLLLPSIAIGTNTVTALSGSRDLTVRGLEEFKTMLTELNKAQLRSQS